MVKKIIMWITLVFLVSCWAKFEINSESLSDSYKDNNRSVNLNDKNITWFVNLNEYMTDKEVNNIFVQNNSIEWIDISDYNDLWTLDISNNNIRFIWDLHLPVNIRHLNLSWNNIESLEWIEKFKKLKTLDVSNNNLSDDKLDVSALENLLYINLKWNTNISEEKLNAAAEFNALYLTNNPVPFSK